MNLKKFVQALNDTSQGAVSFLQPQGNQLSGAEIDGTT